MGSNLSQHGKLSFQGIVRESAFSLPIQKDDQTVQSYFTQSKGEEVMKLDNDAQGRADDIYWLQWTTVDKYGNRTRHWGERMRHATHAKFHIPLESVSVEVVDMNILPNPIYVSCALSCWEPCCGIEGTKPKGSILAVRLSNSTRKIICCIDCGENSNALAFKKAFEDARSRNSTLAPSQITQAFEASFTRNVGGLMAGNMNVFGGIMARGNNMAMLQQQIMQRQMMQMSTMNVATTNQQVPVATATAVSMNTTVPTVTATTVNSAPTAPPKEGMMPNSGNAQSGG
eukprot:g3280.t1